jgi:ADP-ribose pyrophosphatase YjhB (NUDIX family)
MGRRKYAPQKGKYDILGGFLKYGESPKDGAKREILEETGFEIEIFDLLGVYMGEYDFQGEEVPTLNFVYVGRVSGGHKNIGDDIDKLVSLPIGTIPRSLAFKMLRLAFLDLQHWHKTHPR